MLRVKNFAVCRNRNFSIVVNCIFCSMNLVWAMSMGYEIVVNVIDLR